MRCNLSFWAMCLLLAASLFVLPTWIFAAPAESPEEPSSPLSAEDSLQHIRLAPGVRIELVAAEPEVIDPVAVRFDADGRMWVVEMRDYPLGPESGKPPQSRIRIFEDHDGDGHFESVHTFADGLLFPTGLQPWRDGAIVTLAGRVVYFEDTDGDGRADKEETWYTGFAEKNTQLRANHPRFGPDNHIYVANGLRNGKVIDPRRDDAAQVSISGMDFRFDPRTGHYEAVSGMGQFGLTFDDFGNRFLCSNRNPFMHVVLENRYVRRNPLLAVPAVVHDVAAAGPASQIFPLTRAWTTSTLHAGQFTSACGVLIYRSDALPKEFRGCGFTCEPTSNLVHCEVPRPRGATFSSKPKRKGQEFLASRDEWFRPVNLELGPDGALYVVDMYRAVIEHPQFMPEELRSRRDLRHGDEQGRIYRLVADNHVRDTPPPRLSAAPTARLVELLDHPNAWWRDTAARLIYERQDATARGPLEKMVRTGASAPARCQALSSLAGVEGLSAQIVAAALDDPHPRVRERAVQLSELWLDDSSEIATRVVALARDPDARVRFQVALSLGALSSERKMAALADIALAGVDDIWTHHAVASSVADGADRLLAEILSRESLTEKPIASAQSLVRQLAALVGSENNPHSLSVALEARMALSRTATSARIANACLIGLAEGLRRRGKSLGDAVAELSPENTARAESVRRAFHDAADRAAETDAPAGERSEAIELLSHAPWSMAGERLLELATGEPQRSLRIQAIGALRSLEHERIAPALLADFSAQTPAVRRAVIDTLLAKPARCEAVLEALVAGRLKPSALDPLRAQQLKRNLRPALRQRAGELFADAVADRREAIEVYRPALSLAADELRGREVFNQRCSTCHRVDGIGVDVGPDIADSRTRSPEQLLTDILQPNRAIDANYVNYTVVFNDGRIQSGIITTETATSITLRQAENKQLIVLRTEIDEIQSTGVSLMPDGLEKDISVGQMADLISFIKNWRYLDGRIPLDKPADGPAKPR